MGVNYGRAVGGAAVAALKLTPAGQAYSAVKGIVSAPGKLIGSIFGGGPPAWKLSQTLKDYERARDAAKMGDAAALERLAQIAGLRRPDYPGTKYSVIRDRATTAYNNIGAQWGASTGRVSAASRSLVPLSTRSVSRAQPAPKPKRPCKYGARVDGYCPKKPPSASRQTTVRRSARPCKYGPRDADGYCPKKNSLGSTAVRRRAETAVSRAVERAVVAGARKISPSTYAKLGATAASVGRFAAKASLVGLAGLAAYWVTKQVQRIRFKTYDDLRYEVAQAYRRSRQAIAEAEGRGLTPAEGAQLSQWFKARTATIDDMERRGENIRDVYHLTFGD